MAKTDGRSVQQVQPAALLAFERAWAFHRHDGSKERAIRAEFGIGATHYWQQLRTLLVDPDPALAVEFPEVFARLNRQRRGHRVA